MKCKIPNRGRGFFVEAKNKSEAMKKGKQRQKRINETAEIINATKIDRACAPAFKSPYFISVKR